MFTPMSGASSAWFSRRPQEPFVIGVECGDEEWTLVISPVVFTLSAGRPAEAALRFSAPTDVWASYAEPTPAPGRGAIAGLHRSSALAVEGDLTAFYRDQLLIEDVFSRLLRGAEGATAPRADPAPAPGEVLVEPIVGRYVSLEIDGRRHRVYVEEAGEGIPLLCLHTAGSDSRQYRGVLNDPAITERFRVVAFDLPWHGKSSPPAGYQHESYRLTADDYCRIVLTMSDALGLERPVVMGCSIGGRLVLELGLRHPDRFRAGIGLQSAPSAARGEADSYRTLSIARRPDVNGPEAAAARVRPLMGPTSPEADRWETLWHYMQSGPGVFEGDAEYYFDSGVLSEEEVRALASSGFPLYLLSGDYDLGVPADTAAAFAEKVGARRFVPMRGLGHFPMSEDPARFARFLAPVLDEIAEEASNLPNGVNC